MKKKFIFSFLIPCAAIMTIVTVNNRETQLELAQEVKTEERVVEDIATEDLITYEDMTYQDVIREVNKAYKLNFKIDDREVFERYAASLSIKDFARELTNEAIYINESKREGIKTLFYIKHETNLQGLSTMAEARSSQSIIYYCE